MAERKSIAVLDANAFISMSNIRNLGATTRLVTTEDVLAELRDLKTKEFVDSFPFPIETINCDDKVLELVKDFAKRTGDIASLSQVDLELIAITHQLYKREGLESQLRKNPPPIQEKDDLQELYNKEDLSSDEEESSEEDTQPLEIVEKPEEENKEEEAAEPKVETKVETGETVEAGEAAEEKKEGEEVGRKE
jgi:RNA-binding protein NOB1